MSATTGPAEIFRAVAVRPDGRAVTCWARREGDGFRCAETTGPTWTVSAVYDSLAEAEPGKDHFDTRA